MQTRTTLAAAALVAAGALLGRLLCVFAVGYPGYFDFDAIWPSFYYAPIVTGKNAWLIGQAFFSAVYFAGVVVMFNAVRRALNAIPAIAN